MKCKRFPILYGQDNSKRIKTWEISVECDDNRNDFARIITKHGLESGKKVETERIVESGKNLGRSNETSVYEQALQETRSKWRKKKDLDRYTENLCDLDGNDLEYKTVPSPMLAQEFNKHKLKISYPCFVQPKLDGYRAVFYQGKLYTRKGLEYNSEVVGDILGELSSVSWMLDGELYISNDNFSDLGVLRKKKLSVDDVVKCKSIRYCVYDIIDRNLKYIQRKEILDKLFEGGLFGRVLKVETDIARSEVEIKEFHNMYIENYEGTMIRNGHTVYECGKRSYNLQKYKDFMDAEFLITGYSKEQGDLVLWHCRTESGGEFRVSSMGTKLERKKLYLEGDRYIGKMLWVKFFEYTPDGLPRFPKTMRPGVEAIRVELL